MSTTRQNESAPRIVFAGGGTGGHLYPALAVAAELRDRLPDARFVFFCTTRFVDRCVLEDSGFEVAAQDLPPLSAKPWRIPGVVRRYFSATLHCRARFRADPPICVIGTGGYASIPPVWAACGVGVPTLLFNPDAAPGRANRLLARRADVVCVQWERTKACFSRAVTRVTGCPVRPSFDNPDRSAAIRRFGLSTDRRTLLVNGGSQGARTVNMAVIELLDFLETRENWQIIHVTGDADFATVRCAYEARAIPSAVVSFTEHMSDALAAADLVLSRAGASTLAEIMAVGRASVLMPYPFDRTMHQLANAKCLERASAARVVLDVADPRGNAEALRPLLAELMEAHDVRCEMADAAREMGHVHAASAVADEAIGLIERAVARKFRKACSVSTALPDLV